MVDFFAPKTKLVVAKHFEDEQTEKDRHRDDYLAGVLRFYASIAGR